MNIWFKYSFLNTFALGSIVPAPFLLSNTSKPKEPKGLDKHLKIGENFLLSEEQYEGEKLDPKLFKVKQAKLAKTSKKIANCFDEGNSTYPCVTSVQRYGGKLRIEGPNKQAFDKIEYGLNYFKNYYSPGSKSKEDMAGCIGAITHGPDGKQGNSDSCGSRYNGSSWNTYLPNSLSSLKITSQKK